MSVKLQFEFNLCKFLHEAPLANLGGAFSDGDTYPHDGHPLPLLLLLYLISIKSACHDNCSPNCKWTQQCVNNTMQVMQREGVQDDIITGPLPRIKQHGHLSTEHTRE